MQTDILDPLTEYINVFHPRFKKVAESTFAELAAEAQVDVQANRETCKQIYANEKKLSSIKTRKNCWMVWCILLWTVALGGTLWAYFQYQALQAGTLTLLLAVILASLLHLFLKVHPLLKSLKQESQRLTTLINQLKDEAWQQMSPLNRLYDWDVLTRMMSRTVPRLEFDPYFTTQRLADLRKTYAWDDTFNTERSVIYSHSGLINGNPFIICRTRMMEMGTETYHGSKTIYWSTQERDENGKYQTVQHSETLTATVTAPYPLYPEKTRLIYGNTAAPDLIFYRKQSGLANKEDSLSFKWKRHILRKKARNLSNADFAMMTNEEFEVIFNTSNRNNNQQYALLFTPLAQENMTKLLQDNEWGYGDDFDFSKEKMINTIEPLHMQELNLDLNPDQYRSFDYDKAQQDFYNINAQYFRAIYFSLAPLLCIPMYQQIRPQHDIYGQDIEPHSAFWEHEALANFWGQDHFRHPQCVTNCILKTEEQKITESESKLIVHAYGYRSEQRLTHVSVWGGDGRSHQVPVYWDEYLPVTGEGQITMKEDNDFKDQDITQIQRLNHIDDVLSTYGLNQYRRHIASKV